MASVVETKEAIVAVAVLYKAVRDLAKDGIQWTDAIQLWDKYEKDPAFAAKIDAGLKGLDMLGAELADISLFEGLELVRVIRSEFSK